MQEEFDRFVMLFDQMALFGEHWLDRMRVEQLDWAPIENASMKFGDRVSRITVKGLVIHVCIGEGQWFDKLKSCASGDVIPTPKDPDLEREIGAGDFRETARALHRANMAKLKAYTPEDLQKEVVFSERRWTVMGFLWAIYAHRAFHLGNIDIYLRQSDIIAPDFFRFPAMQMA